jgi:hypothetical protein
MLQCLHRSLKRKKSRLRELPGALGISEESARTLAQHHPEFLSLKTAAMSAGWAAIRHAAASWPEWRQEVTFQWATETLFR